MRSDRMLMIDATYASLMHQTTPYFRDQQLVRRANLPYAITVIRKEPPEPARPSPVLRGLPPSRVTVPSTVIDATQDEDDAQFFRKSIF